MWSFKKRTTSKSSFSFRVGVFRVERHLSPSDFPHQMAFNNCVKCPDFDNKKLCLCRIILCNLCLFNPNKTNTSVATWVKSSNVMCRTLLKLTSTAFCCFEWECSVLWKEYWGWDIKMAVPQLERRWYQGQARCLRFQQRKTGSCLRGKKRGRRLGSC